MSITITCKSEKCGYTTDIELTSETNPNHCPECGDELMIDGMGEPLYGEDGEYNKIMFGEEE